MDDYKKYKVDDIKEYREYSYTSADFNQNGALINIKRYNDINFDKKDYVLSELNYLISTELLKFAKLVSILTNNSEIKAKSIEINHKEKEFSIFYQDNAQELIKLQIINVEFSIQSADIALVYLDVKDKNNTSTIQFEIKDDGYSTQDITEAQLILCKITSHNSASPDKCEILHFSKQNTHELKPCKEFFPEQDGYCVALPDLINQDTNILKFYRSTTAIHVPAACSEEVAFYIHSNTVSYYGTILPHSPENENYVFLGEAKYDHILDCDNLLAHPLPTYF